MVKKENILDPHKQLVEENLVEDVQQDKTDPLDHEQADYRIEVDELREFDDENYKSRGLK